TLGRPCLTLDVHFPVSAATSLVIALSAISSCSTSSRYSINCFTLVWPLTCIISTVVQLACASARNAALRKPCARKFLKRPSSQSIGLRPAALHQSANLLPKAAAEANGLP